ncbi:MAG: DNA polymerase III subunit delta [Clostridiales bacterium]|nr:DNA polymerase III subunit delta [Clostridiales bacterium]
MELRQLVGNQPLKRALAGVERPPHAVIISGPVGSGRHTLARLLAQALVCEGRSPYPCGECPHCRRVAEGIHPDVMGLERFVPAEELGKDVKVNTVRAIRSDAQIRPNQARRKVYLIDQPINLPAQNAMLKLLEEGPPYAAFLLVTENSAALLDTVRSRCAQYHTAPVSPAEAESYLTRRFPERDREKIARAAESSQGLLGQAVSFLEEAQPNDGTAARTETWLNALLERSEWELMTCAADTQREKLSRDGFVALYTALGQRFRDGAVAAAGGQVEETQWAERLAQTFTVRQLIEFRQLTEQALEQCRFYAHAHSAGWLAVRLYEECQLLA